VIARHQSVIQTPVDPDRQLLRHSPPAAGSYLMSVTGMRDDAQHRRQGDAESARAAR
jgi:hypothetical protein